MPTNAILAKGTLVKRGDGGSPETFTTIPECGTITGPTLNRDLIDVTAQDSAGDFREFINGLADAGEISFEMRYVPADPQHAGMLADWISGDRRNYKIVFPDVGASEWSFQALVTGFSITADVADALKSDVTLKITGQPTFV